MRGHTLLWSVMLLDKLRAVSIIDRMSDGCVLYCHDE